MRVLAVDDERESCAILARLLSGWGFSVETAYDGKEALERAAAFSPHILVTDLVMPGIDGFELLANLASEGRQVPAIVLTAFGNIEVALRVIHQLGAFWFIEKPIHEETFRWLMSRAAAEVGRAREEERLWRQLAYRGSLADLTGCSPPMQKVFSLIQQVAPTKVPVLISGESGTGKELAARPIHQLSRRSRGPFLALNCAAIPQDLIESELFGHEKGAFTGAAERRPGCFERANGGTLLLDELGEMPAFLQVKLLRVLEDSMVRPLGAGPEVRVDVRVIAATNSDVQPDGGKLREDLFYRLSVFQIHMPALRERPGDIPLLVEALIASLNVRHHCEVAGVEERTLRLLEEHRWPGNIRELRNVLERAVVIAGKGTIRPSHLPPGFDSPGEKRIEPVEGDPVVRLTVGTKISELERELIQLTLSHAENDK
ncbi:MAG TPA: sigma-54 dependent transcriptional regulator, partial [Bryobacteraceae bacterium]|nr:sigma-54 dependent transcriptional regulator [Bryobacteraceae bacterium]